MSDKPVGPLRRRMIEDMTVRNFVEETRNNYIRHVRTFTTFLGRAPDTAAPEDLRLFQLHQTQIGVGAPSINGSVAALRFFFTVTLDRPEMTPHLTCVREPRRIPAILSLEEIAGCWRGTSGPKYKAALAPPMAPDCRSPKYGMPESDSKRFLIVIQSFPRCLRRALNVFWRYSGFRTGRLADQRVATAGTLVLRKLGETRAGEKAVHRFLSSPYVSVDRIVETLAARTAAQCTGRRILAIQDTSEINFSGRDKKRRGFGPGGDGITPGFFIHP